MRDAGLGSWTARRERMSPHRVALIDEAQETTYADLAQRATRAALALRGLGVRRGDRVAYLGPNHRTFLEVLFGTAQLGAIFVPLNTRLAGPHLRRPGWSRSFAPSTRCVTWSHSTTSTPPCSTSRKAIRSTNPSPSMTPA
jgi:acyl-CoA synthetase (AMP-forming)/AMP-acid ligase II